MLEFIGIGARRAGEDWLYHQLGRHPEIHFPCPLETRFWSEHYPKSLASPQYGYGLERYRIIFSHWEDRRR